VSRSMVEHARETYGDLAFTDEDSDLEPAEYAVASGVFNVKLDAEPSAWEEYALAGLDRLDSLSTAGFAFNMLTSYSDVDRMRDDLYYADPMFYFEHCKRHFARNVALLHDYQLYEFTLLVRKELD